MKSAILADGKIDAPEAAALRQALFADGQVDQSEADLLFELNNGCSGADNDPSWAMLFTDAIASFLLNDGPSPGEVDADEAKWLLQHIQGDGKLDDTEKQLLLRLKEKAKGMPDELAEFIKANT